MRVKILTHIPVDKVLNHIPKHINAPQSSMLVASHYTLLLFSIDFQKSVIRATELRHALAKIDGKEPIIIVAGQLTLDAQEVAMNLNAIVCVKRDVHPWTDESYNSIKVDLGRKSHD